MFQATEFLGMHVTIAAGNGNAQGVGQNFCSQWLQGTTHINIGATDITDARASFSNYGPVSYLVVYECCRLTNLANSAWTCTRQENRWSPQLKLDLTYGSHHCFMLNC